MADQIVVSESMLASLNATKPWVKFLAILGFIGCGFMILGALLVLAGGAAMPGGFGALGTVVAVVYLLFAAVFFFPCLYLLRYGNAIGRIAASGQAAMEEALSRQKSYWKFIGIFAIVLIALEICVFLGAIVMGVMSKGG